MSIEKKIIAAGKIVKGAAQVASGVVTASGHGLIGTACRNSNMLTSAAIIGKKGCDSGAKSIKEGIRELTDDTE